MVSAISTYASHSAPDLLHSYSISKVPCIQVSVLIRQLYDAMQPMERITDRLDTRLSAELFLKITHIWKVHGKFAVNGCPLPYLLGLRLNVLFAR